MDSVCGVSILDEWHVITAAHCVDDGSGIAGITKEKVNNMQIRYGAKNIETGGGNVVGASAIYEHYEFVRSSLINDIAIIRTDRPMQLNERAKAICLPEKGEMVPIGQEAFVAGWGYMNEGAFWIQDQAREVMVPVVPDSLCDEAYDNSINEHTEVCAGYKAGGKDACQGDSGGPLVTKDEGGKGVVLQGLVSWGHGCARAGKYGVYTRVSSYIDWIKHAINVVDNCKDHHWCQNGKKSYTDLDGPGESGKDDGKDSDGASSGFECSRTADRHKKCASATTKAPATKSTKAPVTTPAPTQPSGGQNDECSVNLEGVNGTRCSFKKGKTTCKKGKAKCTVTCQNGKMVGSTGNGGKKSCTCKNVVSGWDCVGSTGSSSSSAAAASGSGVSKWFSACNLSTSDFDINGNNVRCKSGNIKVTNCKNCADFQNLSQGKS